MPDLVLHKLPSELQAALERAWPGCPEAQRRALLAPPQLGSLPLWPDGLWAWRPVSHWWRPMAAHEERARAQSFFGAHLSDARGEPYGAQGPAYAQRLFDPAQPFFDTPWTQARVLLRSPAPEAFSDAEFWVIVQRLWGGRVGAATAQAERWASAMKADGALRGARRSRWLSNAQWLLNMEVTGSFL